MVKRVMTEYDFSCGLGITRIYFPRQPATRSSASRLVKVKYRDAVQSKIHILQARINVCMHALTDMSLISSESVYILRESVNFSGIGEMTEWLRWQI